MFTDPFRKVRCPFCNSEFYLGECTIVSKVGQRKILRPVPSGVRRFISRIWIESLSNPVYTRQLASRQCPHCHSLLPYNTSGGVVDNLTIAVIGDTFAGKTTYIAVLIDQLKRKNINFAGKSNIMKGLVAISSETDELYYQNYYRPLFNSRRALSATPQTFDPVRQPLIYEIYFEGNGLWQRPRHVNLILYDASGEDIASESNLVQYTKHILNADALIFLADPWAMPGFINHLAHHLRPDPNSVTGRMPSDILNKVIQLYQRDKGEKVSLQIPVAIALPKSDLLHYSVDDQAQRLGKVIETEYEIDVNYFHLIDMEVRTFMAQIGENSLLSLSKRLANANYFAISSTGSPIDAQGQFASIHPIHCLDPFIWILWKLRIIDTF